MKLKDYKVLGHKVQYSVPENSAEFNALDPKRPDAACEEAVSNIVYRSMNPDTRYWFLHGRSADDIKKMVEDKTVPEGKLLPIIGVEDLVPDLLNGYTPQADPETGIVPPLTRKVVQLKGKDGKPRTKDGEPVTKFDEAEEAYYNRVLAYLVDAKKFASEDLARAHFHDLIVQCASEVPFDITAPEKGERGPKKLAAKYKNAAAKVIVIGNVDKVNANQLTKIGKTFTPSGDTSKMFTGTFPDEAGNDVPFNVSDKDAETLGWMIKEYFDWKATQEMLSL